MSEMINCLRLIHAAYDADGADLSAWPGAAADAIEEATEAAEILDNLMDSVRKHGNYSQEATLLFLSQARQCLNCLTPNAGNDPR